MIGTGSRVRVAEQEQTTFAVDTGTVSGDDEVYRDWYVVQLDQPATYHRADGTDEAIAEVVAHFDHLTEL